MVLSHETGREVDTCGQEREVSTSLCTCVLLCGVQFSEKKTDPCFPRIKRTSDLMKQSHGVKLRSQVIWLIASTQKLHFRSFGVLLTNLCLLFQIPPRLIDVHPDQSSGLGPHRHAQWAASNQDLPRETLLPERGHARKDTPLQPTLGTARWESNTHSNTHTQ